MITRKQIKLATKLISPEAGKVLARFRTMSRAVRTGKAKDKPIRKIKVRVAEFPSYSGAHSFQTVSLARVDFIKRTDKYFTGENNG